MAIGSTSGGLGRPCWPFVRHEELAIPSPLQSDDLLELDDAVADIFLAKDRLVNLMLSSRGLTEPDPLEAPKRVLDCVVFT